MKFGLASYVLFAGYLCFCTVQPGSAAEQDFAKLFGSLPDFGAASISPGGKTIAFETPIDGVENIVFIPLEQGGAGWRFVIADRFAHHLAWRDDTQLFATLHGSLKSTERMTFGSPNGERFYPFYQNALLSGRSDNPVQRLNIFPFGWFGPSSIITELNSSDPDAIFFSTIVQWVNPRYFSTDLYRLDLPSERAILVQQGEGETARWFMDGAGNILARLDITRTGEDVVFVPDGRNFRKIATMGAADGRVVGLTEDGKSLAVLGRRGGNRLGLHRLRLDGTFDVPLFVNADSDVRRVLFDERNFRVIGVTYDDPSLRFAYLNPERQRLQKQIEDVLPGRTVNLVSASADRSKIAVVSSGPQNPPLLQLVNLKTSRIDVFAEAYPPLNGMRFGEVRRYPYTSRDGVALVGLVTLPPQGEAKNLPVVVLPAGGLGYAIDAFDWFAQFLAQRGYAVFQAGARNLKELGDIEHMDELGSWMTSSQNDIVEGVDDLVAKGIADPSRICIAGAGNGGYIALSAMIVMPGKYACAISLAGFSDLRSIWQKAWDNARPAQHVFSSTLIRNRMNYSDDDVSRFSPARHAEAVQGPVLLIFGDRDSGKLQGDKMNEALLGAHKAVEYVTLRNEDGTLSRAEGRVALLNAVDKFLAAHIGK